MSRVLLVGENNPLSADPAHALYPYPAANSGGRLCRILGMSPDEYLHTFDRTNLLSRDRWSAAAAREAAERVVAGPHRRVVALGVKVASAFGVPTAPFAVHTVGGTDVAVLPHPSGLCRVWNNPDAELRARAYVYRALGRSL